MKEIEIYSKYLSLKQKVSELEQQKNSIEGDLQQQYLTLHSKIELFEKKFEYILKNVGKYILLILASIVIVILIINILFNRNKSSKSSGGFLGKIWNFIFSNLILPFLLDKIMALFRRQFHGGIIPLKSKLYRFCYWLSPLQA